MSPQTLLFVTATPNSENPQATQDYLQQVMPLLMKAGGKPLARGMVQEVVHGAPGYQMALVMEFAGPDDARAVFSSDSYKELIPARDLGFTNFNITLAKAL